MSEKISATLLRRLAEAADGFRDGQDHYFVFHRDRPDPEDRPFDRLDEAEKYLAGLPTKAEFGLFGPYRTEEKSEEMAGLESITVTTRRGASEEIDLEAYDSIFWTVSAIDKFLIPYYTRVLGVSAAAILRDELISWDFVRHPPWSYPMAPVEKSDRESGPTKVMEGRRANGTWVEVIVEKGPTISFQTPGS